MTALWTEACLTFPALGALKEGYEVYIVADAVGGTSVTAHEVALRRIEQAGGKMISVPQLFCELQRDWQRKETVPAFMNLFIETGGTASIQFAYDYVHFFPGDFFKTKPAGKAVDYFTTWMTYKF